MQKIVFIESGRLTYSHWQCYNGVRARFAQSIVQLLHAAFAKVGGLGI
jgi:hypothetical protein